MLLKVWCHSHAIFISELKLLIEFLLYSSFNFILELDSRMRKRCRFNFDESLCRKCLCSRLKMKQNKKHMLPESEGDMTNPNNNRSNNIFGSVSSMLTNTNSWSHRIVCCCFFLFSVDFTGLLHTLMRTLGVRSMTFNTICMEKHQMQIQLTIIPNQLCMVCIWGFFTSPSHQFNRTLARTHTNRVKW